MKPLKILFLIWVLNKSSTYLIDCEENPQELIMLTITYTEPWTLVNLTAYSRDPHHIIMDPKCMYYGEVIILKNVFFYLDNIYCFYFFQIYF